MFHACISICPQGFNSSGRHGHPAKDFHRRVPVASFAAETPGPDRRPVEKRPSAGTGEHRQSPVALRPSCLQWIPCGSDALDQHDEITPVNQFASPASVSAAPAARAHLLQMPELLEAVVRMLDSALPDDWTMLERGLRAALALASTAPQVISDSP
jgi:hypothetical protein